MTLEGEARRFARQRSRGESHDAPLFRRRAGQSPMELNVTLPKEHDHRTPPMGAKLPNFRWLQLLIGIVCMVMIANLQYGWTLFVTRIDQKFHWGRPAIQVAFTIFIVMQTWLVPFEGYLIDRLGPRIVVCAGGQGRRLRRHRAPERRDQGHARSS